MERLCTVRPEGFAGIAVDEVYDLNKGAMGLPKSNVVYYRLADGSVLVVRPSGTEPKVKVYVMVKDRTQAEAVEKAEALRKDFYAFAGIDG